MDKFSIHSLWNVTEIYTHTDSLRLRTHEFLRSPNIISEQYDISLTHAHTHTHPQRKRKRDIDAHTKKRVLNKESQLNWEENLLSIHLYTMYTKSISVAIIWPHSLLCSSTYSHTEREGETIRAACFLLFIHKRLSVYLDTRDVQHVIL